MSIKTASDPSVWCFAELDAGVCDEDLDRFLNEHEVIEERDETEASWGLDAVGPMQARGRLLEAIDVLTTTLAEGRKVISTNHVLAPMLEIWELADAVGGDVAAPLETMLGHLMQDHHADRDDLMSLLDGVRRAAA